MDVKLVCLGGQQAGRAVPVPGPKFFIGRDQDCQLRPKSDLVSRHHCVILVEEGFVAIRDLGSRNGTFLNSDRIRGETPLKTGDRLRVGDLEFEVQVNVSVGGKKKPKVQSVQEAAARTVASSEQKKQDLDDWLVDENVDSARISAEETRTIEMPTKPAKAKRPPVEEFDEDEEEEEEVRPKAKAKRPPVEEFDEDEEEEEVRPKAKAKKKVEDEAEETDDEAEPTEPRKKSGKGPGLWDKGKRSDADSKKAASDMLRNFFRKF